MRWHESDGGGVFLGWLIEEGGTLGGIVHLLPDRRGESGSHGSVQYRMPGFCADHLDGREAMFLGSSQTQDSWGGHVK